MDVQKFKKKFKRLLVIVSITLALCYGAIFIVAYWFPYVFVFQPPGIPYELDQYTTMIETSDGESLAVMYYPPPNAHAPTILYSHGNGENIWQKRALMQTFQDWGYGACNYDYPGYGLSTGSATERTCYQDVISVYDYLTQEKGISNIFSYGYSLGGAPAIQLATEKPVSGLILESAFISGLRVVTGVKILPFDYFPNAEKIQKINCPVMIMHGTADWIIRMSHGEKLYELAREPKRAYWVAGAGHTDLMQTDVQEYENQLTNFIASANYKY